MTQLPRYIVYCHINKENGKKYVGITSRSTEERWQKNGSGYKGSTLFLNAINKYGWDNFIHLVIIKGLLKEDAENLEKDIIAKFNLTDDRFGYNLMSGGGCNGQHNEKTKQKISNKLKGRPLSEETRRKIGESQKGKKLSEAQRRQLSESRKGKAPTEQCRLAQIKALTGKKQTEETKMKRSKKMMGHPPYNGRPVFCLTTSTVYESTLEAERKTGAHHTNISKCCQGERKTAGGLTWQYV